MRWVALAFLILVSLLAVRVSAQSVPYPFEFLVGPIPTTPPGPAFVQYCHASASNACTFGATPTSADLMVAIGGDDVNGLTCNTGAGWAQVQHFTSLNVDGISCSKAVSGDTATVTPLTGTSATRNFSVWEVSGSSLTVDAFAGNESGVGGNTLSISPTQAQDVIVSAGYQSQTGTTSITTPSGYAVNRTCTSGCGSAGVNAEGAAYLVNAPSGLQTLTWTFNGSNRVVTALAVAVRGAGATRASYTYHGCQVYNGTAATGDPIANAIITSAPVDTNSANILTNKPFTISGSSTAGLERANLTTTGTWSLFTVQTNGGHNPPITLGPNGGGAGAQVPWLSTFFFEGATQGPCAGDCHWLTLATDTCFAYEGGGGTFTGGTTFGTYNGIIDALADTYTNNWANKSTNVTVAGIPLVGFTLFGEDLTAAASGTPINHPGDLIINTSMLLSGTNGVNISPGAGNGGGSCAGAANCYELGDLLRLKPGFTCAGADAKANAWIAEAQTYGVYVTDTGSSITIRMGLDTSGADDTSAPLLSCIHSADSTHWDLITRGTVLP